MKSGPPTPVLYASTPDGIAWSAGKISVPVGNKFSGIRVLCGSMYRKYPSKFRAQWRGLPAWKTSRRRWAISCAGPRHTRRISSFLTTIVGFSSFITLRFSLARANSHPPQSAPNHKQDRGDQKHSKNDFHIKTRSRYGGRTNRKETERPALRSAAGHRHPSF